MSRSALSGLVDNHVHSATGSMDATATIVELCEQARALRLCGICFTEHLDCNVNLPEYGYYDYTSALQAIKIARDRFGDQLDIRMGLEVEYDPRYFDADFIRQIRQYAVDFVLGAVHLYDGLHFNQFVELQRSIMTDDDLTCFYQVYFSQVRDLIRYGVVDVLAHLDYPVKCDIRGDTQMLPAVFEDELGATLSLAVEYGVGIEVNTRRNNRTQALSVMKRILQQYIALGGSCVTLGSDAHHLSRLADGLDIGRSLLYELGISQQALYRSRQVTLLPI